MLSRTEMSRIYFKYEQPFLRSAFMNELHDMTCYMTFDFSKSDFTQKTLLCRFTEEM